MNGKNPKKEELNALAEQELCASDSEFEKLDSTDFELTNSQLDKIVEKVEKHYSFSELDTKITISEYEFLFRLSKTLRICYTRILNVLKKSVVYQMNKDDLKDIPFVAFQIMREKYDFISYLTEKYMEDIDYGTLAQNINNASDNPLNEDSLFIETWKDDKCFCEWDKEICMRIINESKKNNLTIDNKYLNSLNLHVEDRIIEKTGFVLYLTKYLKNKQEDLEVLRGVIEAVESGDYDSLSAIKDLKKPKYGKRKDKSRLYFMKKTLNDIENNYCPIVRSEGGVFSLGISVFQRSTYQMLHEAGFFRTMYQIMISIMEKNNSKIQKIANSLMSRISEQQEVTSCASEFEVRDKTALELTSEQRTRKAEEAQVLLDAKKEQFEETELSKQPSSSNSTTYEPARDLGKIDPRKIKLKIILVPPVYFEDSKDLKDSYRLDEVDTEQFQIQYDDLPTETKCFNIFKLDNGTSFMCLKERRLLIHIGYYQAENDKHYQFNKKDHETAVSLFNKFFRYLFPQFIGKNSCCINRAKGLVFPTIELDESECMLKRG